MHRPTIGLIAILLFAIGFYTRSSEDEAVSAACLRIGAVMAILWFAQPQLQGIPRWLIASGAVTLLVAMRWPRLIVLAIPLLAVLWVLRPRAPGSSGFGGRRNS